MALYTVGHSNRSIDDFIALLQAYGIDHLIDIRAIPYSSYNPQFNRDDLARDLARAGIAYSHNQTLAGEPPDRATMKRAVRCSDRSRNYAAYTETEEYRAELADQIAALTADQNVALMCGEKKPDHCHRYVTAGTFENQGVHVSHIVDEQTILPHQPTLF